jgi:hypothetical protein
MLAVMLGVAATPTTLPPPPRQVVGGVGCIPWALRLFILPHMYAGVMIFGQFALAVLVAAFGSDLDATVTKAHTSETSKGGLIYYLDYRFIAGGQTYTGKESVGRNGAPRRGRLRHRTTRPRGYGPVPPPPPASRSGLRVVRVPRCGLAASQ